MNRYLIIFLSLFFLLSASPIESQDSKNVEELIECKYRQCDATAKSTGKRCKHCVSNPNDYQCYQHKPK